MEEGKEMRLNASRVRLVIALLGLGMIAVPGAASGADDPPGDGATPGAPSVQAPDSVSDDDTTISPAEPDYTLIGHGIAVLVGVDGEVRHGVSADGVQDSAGVLGDHLDVTIEHHPVARLRRVPIADGVPPVVGLRVLLDGDDVR